MSDYNLYGKYYPRAEKHIMLELFIGLIFAGAVWYFTFNWFYGFICACFSYNCMRLLNIKNRQLEILNKIDSLSERIEQIGEDKQ